MVFCSPSKEDEGSEGDTPEKEKSAHTLPPTKNIAVRVMSIVYLNPRKFITFGRISLVKCTADIPCNKEGLTTYGFPG